MAANNTVELWLAFDDAYQRALTIPLDTCTNFAQFPLPWLSYLGFTVCGREGHISNSANGPKIAYRPTEPTPVITPGIYYYIAGDPLWLDPEAMNDRTSYSSARSACSQNFRRDVINRDLTCAMTDGPADNCQACHIILHSRGDQVSPGSFQAYPSPKYISNLADYREVLVDPPLESINDIRNGLLLYIALHRPFGPESQIAFLRTPNHAMHVTDVKTLSNNIGSIQRRLTLQHFDVHDHNITLLAPHNSDVRISNGDNWPPDLLFDVTYGCAAIQSWVDPAFRSLIQSHNRGRGRGGGGDGCDNHARSEKPGIVERAFRTVRRAKAKDQGRHTADDSADLVLALWMYNARRGQRQAEAKNADRTRDKVQTWLDSTT